MRATSEVVTSNTNARDAQHGGGAAERMRRSRERRRAGLRFVGIEVFAEQVEHLVRRGLLAEVDANDTAAIGAALERLFDGLLDDGQG